ncbi:AT19640p, putative [Brugia malayi]|uniref:AT19640p, putative n=1 Tax=Brugia malayi TaxID=6279 RepID=A0A0K0JEZ6_BRUMA|nr:AT19640p, putative [Brugia malayi]CTP80962.1 BMA-DMSR-1 [Brugia malayi]VIO97494.1 AT19640p, putative [Brugia malayi]
MNNLERCQTVIIELPENSIVYDWFYAIHTFYSPIHTYLSIALCILGAMCNFCNIVVLTRKRMRTPVNMTLTAMACCDTVVLFSNLIYTTHYTLAAFANCHPKQWSYGWAVFLVCHAHLSLIGHSSSIWLSVMLALIRYMTLRSRRKVNVLQIHLRHSYMAIAFVVFFVTLMNTPNFLAYKIIEMKLSETCNITDTGNYDASAYVPGVSDLALQAHCLIFRMAFWISGTVFKMTPCLLLSSFVWLLMKILTRVQQNRLKLLYHSTRFYNGKHESKKKHRGQSKTDTAKTNTSIVYRADRTTRMLLTILCVFLITELPQGIMMVLSGILPEAFRRHIYNSLGDLLDLLSLCNSCTTFVIYCSMSEQFRNEFKQVFLPNSFFDHKLRWNLKRNYKESSSHSTTDASSKNAFELPRNVLDRNIEGVCPAVTATSELPMESSMTWSQCAAENNLPEKLNTNIGNTENDEDASLLHSSA